jgi:hypothetical protein
MKPLRDTVLTQGIKLAMSLLFQSTEHLETGFKVMKSKVFFCFALISLSTVALAIASDDPRSELDSIQCSHWRRSNEDPDLSVSFKFEEDSDFAKVTVQERVKTRYSADIHWVTIIEEDVQVSSSKTHFGFNGDDTLMMDIKRPVLKDSQKPNASIELLNGEMHLDLYCTKR